MTFRMDVDWMNSEHGWYRAQQHMCGKSIVVWALMTRSGEQESWCSLLATDATPSSSPLLWAASSAVEVVAGRRKHMEGESGVGHNTMQRPPAPLYSGHLCC